MLYKKLELLETKRMLVKALNKGKQLEQEKRHF